jgi:hypothetical protein
MNGVNSRQGRTRQLQVILSAFVFVLCCGATRPAWGAAWHGLEPLKSRLADVEREFGKSGETLPGGALRFKVSGGTVTVTFVSAKFVATKKLDASYEGAVLEVVLQHENAVDTPESLNLPKNGDFQRDAQGAVTVYRNLKDGISYTFVNGRLRTTRYAPGADQLAHAKIGIL